MMNPSSSLWTLCPDCVHSSPPDAWVHSAPKIAVGAGKNRWSSAPILDRISHKMNSRIGEAIEMASNWLLVDVRRIRT